MIRALTARVLRPEVILMASALLTVAWVCAGAVMKAKRERRAMAELVVEVLEARSDHAGE